MCVKSYQTSVSLKLISTFGTVWRKVSNSPSELNTASPPSGSSSPPGS